MNKPKFSLGTMVKDVKANKWGKVEHVFEGWYGWGYYIRHSGWTWSLPEESLSAYKKAYSHCLGENSQKCSIRDDN